MLHAPYFTAKTLTPESSQDHDGITSQSSRSISSVESSYIESSELLLTQGVAITNAATTISSIEAQKLGRITNSINQLCQVNYNSSLVLVLPHISINHANCM